MQKPCLDCGTLTRNGSRCGPAENDCARRHTARRRAAGATGHVGRHIPTRMRAQVIDEQAGRCGRCGIHQDDLKKRTPPEFLEVHHVDGNPANHTRSNFAAYCPDCHRAVEAQKGAA